MNAKDYQSKINPGEISDGHCAFCSWNTCLGMKGYPLEEALEPGSTNSVIVGRWLYTTFVQQGRNRLGELNNGYDPDVAHFKQQVKNLLLPQPPGDVFLLTVDDGTHWISAQHVGGDIVFVDAQSGIGFNTYEKKVKGKPHEPVREDTSITVFRVTEDVIAEYMHTIKPTLVQGWKGTTGYQGTYKHKNKLKQVLTKIKRKLQHFKKLKQTRRRRRG
jgi:hypothetical protein